MKLVPSKFLIKPENAAKKRPTMKNATLLKVNELAKRFTTMSARWLTKESAAQNMNENAVPNMIANAIPMWSEFVETSLDTAKIVEQFLVSDAATQRMNKFVEMLLVTEKSVQTAP